MLFCKFCAAQTDYSPIKEMRSRSIDVFFCDPCQTEYVKISSMSEIWNTSIYIKLNDNTYRWSVNKYGGQLWRIKNPGIPGQRINEDLYMIKSFSINDIPDITPSNIMEKIKVWLLLL